MEAESSENQEIGCLITLNIFKEAYKVKLLCFSVSKGFQEIVSKLEIALCGFQSQGLLILSLSLSEKETNRQTDKQTDI